MTNYEELYLDNELFPDFSTPMDLPETDGEEENFDCSLDELNFD
jgi:hypothetical protein